MVHLRRGAFLVPAFLGLMLTVCASDPAGKAKQETRQAEGLYRLAQLDFNQGKNQEAIAHARKSLDLDPKHADVHSFLGVVYLVLSDYRNAEKSLLEAVKLNPYLTDARNTLGAVYMKTGRAAEAESVFVECLKDKTYPHSEKVHFNLGTLQLDAKRAADAAESFRRAVEANPRYARGYYGLGQAQILLGRRADARKSFEKVIELDPASPEAVKSKEALGLPPGATKG